MNVIDAVRARDHRSKGGDRCRQKGSDMEHDHVNDSSALLKRIEELEARVTQLTKSPRAGGPTAAGDTSAAATTSRRGLLKLAGATAVGAAATSLLVAAPAGAADGGAIDIGADNLGEAGTGLRYNGSSGIGGTNIYTVSDSSSPASDYSSMFPSALAGWAQGGPAGVTHGIYGYTDVTGGYGTVGWGVGADTTHGLYGVSTAGYGVVADGARAPLRLVPASSTGAPTSGAHQLGEIWVDSAGILYKCVTAGSPGVWAAVYSTVPLGSPVRVVDTRNGTGGITGPLTANTTATSSNLTGSSGIPAAAIAVVGTITMVATGSDLPGAGFLTAFPGGGTLPSTSNVNADTGHAIASGLTVGLGAGKVSFNASIACHALLDVAAYII